MSIHIFSFGSDHFLPNGDSARDKAVMVDAPDDVDHRMIFMGWLGSNKFSSEYTEDEYRETRMALSTRIAWSIKVEPVCGQCEFAESECKCIPQINWWNTDGMTDEDGEDYS